MENSFGHERETCESQTRRDFLHSAAITGAGLLFSPMISAREELEANVDDINVAIIGVGSQGQVLMDACLKTPGIRIKAICDIWADYNRSRSARILRIYKHEVNEYEDYQQMLAEENDLDAVIIATPDFCHADQTVACLKAGLHVYCESEMSNTIEGAKRMVQTAKETGKLLQIGRQRRSNPRYAKCYNVLLKEENLLGKITAVNGQCNQSARELSGWPEKAPIKQAMLEKYGYKSMEQFKNWSWYKNLGGGPLVSFGSHQIDIYNWFLDAKPNFVMASGRNNYYDKKTHQCYDTVMVIYEYKTSHGSVSAYYQTITNNRALGNFEAFMGDKGTLRISGDAYRGEVYPEPGELSYIRNSKCVTSGLLKKPEELTPLEMFDTWPIYVDESPDPKEFFQQSDTNTFEMAMRDAFKITVNTDIPQHQLHLENFFDTIRGETQLNCPAVKGYETAVTVLKVNEAIEAAQKLEFKSDDFTV